MSDKQITPEILAGLAPLWVFLISLLGAVVGYLEDFKPDDPPRVMGSAPAPRASASRRWWSRTAAWPASSPVAPGTLTPPSPRPSSPSSWKGRRRRTGAASPAPASRGRTSRTRALRESLGLRAGESGIRLTRVARHGSAGGVLKAGDVVLEMGGAKLDPTGYYEHPLYGRMLFALLFSDGRQPDDTMPVKVLRGGLDLRLPLRAMRPEQDRVPPYGP